MSLHLNSPTPISQVFLGEKLIGRMYYNNLIVYEFAETTQTQAWDNTGFMTPSWTLHPNFTAFVFMRGEVGQHGGDWTPRRPNVGDRANILSAYNQSSPSAGLANQMNLTDNTPLTNVTSHWGVLRAQTERRVFTLEAVGGTDGSPPPFEAAWSSWLGTWRLGPGGRGGNGFRLMEGSVVRGSVHGSQGGPGLGAYFSRFLPTGQYINGVPQHRRDNEYRVFGGDPGSPGTPFPPVSLPNDLSTLYPNFASTPFPADFLTSAPPMAAVTMIVKYEPGISA